jgi:hypothetical protein
MTGCATKQSIPQLLDCFASLRFASLAMTVSEPSPDPNRKTRPMHRPGFEIKAL